MLIQRILFLFILLSNTWVWGNYTIIPDAAQLKIMTPDLAQRQTLKIRLENGLEAYIISDPNADQSAAAMVVKAGYWQDPEEHSGVAHFLEHMLFLGTKQYPEEDGYMRYINEHGGSNNAMTNADYTAFMFSVDNGAYSEALNRFSSFFKEPLFNPSGVEREMNAVNQEFGLMHDNDTARMSFVLKELANPKHPFHSFNVGSLETLSKVSQDTLKKWYGEHYSANLMRLMVYSSLPLDQLTALVVEDFSPIVNTNLPVYENTEKILLPESEGKWVFITPVKTVHNLTLVWELPSKFAEMIETKPEHVLCHILGHEGKESLLHELKQERLAESLSCGGVRLAAHSVLLGIDIDLTPEGLEKRNTVVERVFQTLALLKEKGIPEYFFKEVHHMDSLTYKLQNRQEAFQMAMQEASWLPYESMSTFPEYTQVLQRFDPEAEQELLRWLTPERALYVVTAPPELTGVQADKEDPWLKVPYKIVPVPQVTLTQWSQVQPYPEINLPPPNPFIPIRAEVVPPPLNNPSLIPVPQEVVNDPLGKVYFAQNTAYGTPEVYWNIEIRTSQIQPGNASSLVLGDIFVKSLNESLNDLSYNATLGGLFLEITRSEFGINFAIHGYADKAKMLWKDIVDGLKNLQIDESHYENYKDALKREYQNFAKEVPYMQAIEQIRKAIYKDFTTASQKEEAVSKIDFNRFKEFVEKLWNKTYMQAMLYGQTSAQEVKDVWGIWSSAVPSTPYTAGKLAHPKMAMLPEDKGPFYLEKQVTVQGNAVILGIENGSFSMKDYAAQQVLGQSLGQSYFNELRTLQQTGYVVFGYADEVEKHLWTFLLAQSNTHASRDLLARDELFIESYLRDLQAKEIPEARFNIIKESFITQLSQPQRNTQDMAMLLNKLAFKYDGDFGWINARIQGFKELNYEEFLVLSKRYLGRQNKRRLAVLLNGKIPLDNKFQYERLPNFEALRKISTFSNIGL